MPRPPVERANDNPWPEWPKVYKLDYGQEEASAKFGADPRTYLTTVKKFVGDTITVAKGLPREELEALALASDKVQRALDGKAVKKVIVVPDRLVNLVA